ncbi:MAG: divalent-cation tolerance protein CutA [Opitutales bacterium]
MAQLWIAQTTVELREDAEALARQAVEQSLAACVHLEDPIASVFQWEGSVTLEPEVRLTFKTTAARLPALKRFIHEEHPYDTPEWIAWPAGDVSAAYLKWAEASLSGDD